MKINIKQSGNLYAFSDPHFNHSNILKYTDRHKHFKNVYEMNDTLIRNFNKKVSKNDTTIILGDFCFSDTKMFESFWYSLNGEKILVRGNHDKQIPKNIYYHDVVEFTFQDQYFFCSHFAHRVWNRSHYGAYHLYGHSHNSLPDDPKALSMDVGVDAHPNYEPFSFEEIRNHMNKKTFVPVDHHRSNR